MKNKNKERKSQRENQLEPLIDLKPSGKRRNWDKSKRMSLAVATAFSGNPDLEKYGEKIKSCGNDLWFKACPIELAHGKKLVRANFCKGRLCTTCQGRKSNVIRKQVVDLTREHLARYSTDVPLFLTLTILNEPGSNMIKAIDQMTAAWRRLMDLKRVRGMARSWFRSLEVTYNPERDDYHPHFHAVLMVPKAYFRRKNGHYITRNEWLELWKQCMRDDRITQVDIRRIKSKDVEAELESFVGEVAKYATKPSSYIFEKGEKEYETKTQVVTDLHYALRGRRLVAYGGLFNQIRKEKKMVDIEKVDLVNVNGESAVEEHICKHCDSPLIDERYCWSFGAAQYYKVPTRGQIDDEDVQETEVAYPFDLSKETKGNKAYYNDFGEIIGETSSEIEEEPPMIWGINLDGTSPNEPFPLLRGPP